MLSLASSFFDRTPIGRLMTHITSDVEALNEMFASGLVSLLGDVIRLSAILIAIFGIDWKLALFSMGTAPILFASDRRGLPPLRARCLPATSAPRLRRA